MLDRIVDELAKLEAACLFECDIDSVDLDMIAYWQEIKPYIKSREEMR